MDKELDEMMEIRFRGPGMKEGEEITAPIRIVSHVKVLWVKFTCGRVDMPDSQWKRFKEQYADDPLFMQFEVLVKMKGLPW